MENVRAIATFQQIGEEVYRTNTYIQFGTSSQSLGAAVMLNPGSAQLKGEVRRKLVQTGAHTDEVSLDRTMRQLVKFMKATHSNLNGRLYIYNLFYVKNAISKEAIELFESLKSTGNYPTITRPSLSEIQRHPWILIGWGVEKGKNSGFYELEKKKWLELIKESNIPYFGVLSKDNDYYHPNPNGPAHSERLQQLIQAFKKEIEPSISRN
ncbi:uncharacterized protein DUF1643 [Ureibacillus xyleni]|uniref:Uncharacterized protein DUF1643 n=1 Tax=Ureibacillus xyleni TaxID=614648 RepID=A0A285TMY5_9BACL|nr:DUF1643 domain-containing protein [Ureibacillus xyleni]SOC23528.1 uncharacterized protein DUF1643 [Ureibacillus xyleni]